MSERSFRAVCLMASVSSVVVGGAVFARDLPSSAIPSSRTTAVPVGQASTVCPVVAERLGAKASVGYGRIPGTDLYIKPFGKVKVTGVYDQHAASSGPAYDHYLPGHIMRPGAKSERGEFRLHARETSLGMKTFMPLRWISGEDINFETCVEADFFGSNQTEESLFTGLSLRVKKAYLTLGDWLIGQTDSVFSDGDSEPETADLTGPAVLAGGRRPQIRWSPKYENTSFVLAIENPESEYVNKDGETKFAKRVTGSEYFGSDQLPDLTASIRQEFSGGHVQACAVGRKIRLSSTQAKKDISKFGWGVCLSGNYKYFGASNVFFQGTYGKGIGRNLSDANGYAVYLDAQERAHTMAAHGGAIGFQHYWNEPWGWRTTVAYGFTRIHPHKDLISHSYTKGTGTSTTTEYAEINKDVRSFQVNTFFNPFGPKIDVGAEYLRGERVLKTAPGTPSKGHIDRFIVTVKARFAS